jgi:hypothetical protein
LQQEQTPMVWLIVQIVQRAMKPIKTQPM